jgi:adenine phosphoribosyltransferase
MTTEDGVSDLKQLIVETADFPEPGILFRDFSPLLRHEFPATLDALDALLSTAEWQGIDAVAGVDARGFVLGAGLAARRRVGFVPIRKAGKLPPPVHRLSYRLEYGEATLEMHPGSGRLLLVDDVFATGGTLDAAANLCVQSGHLLAAIIVLADLRLTKKRSLHDLPVRSVFHYG